MITYSLDNIGQPLITADGSMTMVHPDHKEPYHAKKGAYFEAYHLYIEASGIEQHLQNSSEPTYILDVGLGLAYNAVLTLGYWIAQDVRSNLYLYSLEINPDLCPILKSQNAPWQSSWQKHQLIFCSQLNQVEPSKWFAVIKHPQKNYCAHWQVNIGNATDQLLQFERSRFQFIWQDPFSPKNNPELWSEHWFKQLATLCQPEAKLLTYSVARSVKDALKNAGWHYEMIPAHQIKRSWLKAIPANTI